MLANIIRPNPVQPKINGTFRKIYEDSVQLPRLYMVWHTVPQDDKDEAALNILSTILWIGRGSRLQSRLIYDKQIAQDVFVSHETREIAGTFQITATANPGKSLDEIEQNINAEIERIKKEPPTKEEVSRSLIRAEWQFIGNLETVERKADLMNSNVTFFNKPDLFQQKLNEYRQVTPDDIRRVSNKYLNANRLVMQIVPRTTGAVSQMTSAASTPTSKIEKEKSYVDYSKNLPKPGPNPELVLPAIEKQKLKNGLEIWLVRKSKLPLFAMNLVLKSGATVDPSEKFGLASLTANLLNDGTKTRSAVNISDQLQNIGAAIRTRSDWDSSNVRMEGLSKNLDKALDIFADVIVNPAFPESELENVRRNIMVGLLQQKDDPRAIAGIVFNNLLYGKNHPYGNMLTGNETSVKSFKQSDLINFYQTYYRPNNAVLIVVGDVNMNLLKPKLEAVFANWQPAEIPEPKILDVAEFDKPGIYLIDKPGAVQSVINIGQIGVSRDNPDFYALQVMNSILGSSSGRLFLNLRQNKGYTYGAYSSFSFRRHPGPFLASANVQTAVTRESVIEFMKELNGIRGSIPVTEQELKNHKQGLIRSYPSGFETTFQVANQLVNQVVYDLPDSVFNEYIPKINAVTPTDVNRVANKYLKPDKMAIVIVGDRKAIEPKLKGMEGWGSKFFYLDSEGNPRN